MLSLVMIGAKDWVTVCVITWLYLSSSKISVAVNNAFYNSSRVYVYILSCVFFLYYIFSFLVVCPICLSLSVCLYVKGWFLKQKHWLIDYAALHQ